MEWLVKVTLPRFSSEQIAWAFHMWPSVLSVSSFASGTWHSPMVLLPFLGGSKISSPSLHLSTGWWSAVYTYVSTMAAKHKASTESNFRGKLLSNHMLLGYLWSLFRSSYFLVDTPSSSTDSEFFPLLESSHISLPIFTVGMMRLSSRLTSISLYSPSFILDINSSRRQRLFLWRRS